MLPGGSHYLCRLMQKPVTRNRMLMLLFIAVPLLIVFLYSLWSPATRKPVKKQPVFVTEIYDPGFAPLSPDWKHAHYDSINAFFYHFMDPADFHGMFLIAKNGKIVYERYRGVANEQSGLRFGPEVPVHVASISKVITAVTVLRLADAKKLKLDDDIRTYLPEIPYAGITIRMLLNHRSGIPYYGYFPKEISPPEIPLSNQRVLDILKTHKPKLYFPPNTLFSYCNTNYALLALIVEKVTQKRFPVAVRELIFEPLEMTHSFIRVPEDSTITALSYNSRGALQEQTQLDPVYGDKNLYTTARDLLRFDSGTYSDKFLSKHMKQEMFKGYSYEKAGKANYGLGMRMREEPGKSTFFFHTGWWHGNTGCYATLRSDSVCMIILSNHYTRKVFGINKLSLLFGNYPFATLDPMKKSPAEKDEE